VPKLATASITSLSLAMPTRTSTLGCSERASFTRLPAVFRGLCVVTFCLSFMAAFSVACGSALAPVVNVSNAPVAAPRGEAATRESVRAGILRALTGRGWRIVREDSSGIVAAVSSVGQSATVHIRYDERSYSIHYVDSSPGLRFDGVMIHHRYNDWIERLDRSVRAQLLSPPSNDVRVVAAVGAGDARGVQPQAAVPAEALDAKPSAESPDDPVMPPAPPPPPPAPAAPRQ